MKIEKKVEVTSLGIELEDDIPVPVGSDRRSAERKYPLNEMKIGQSFFLPLEDGDNLKRMANRLSQARQTYQKKYEGVRFTQRLWEQDDSNNVGNNSTLGIRIWRVE